MTDKLDRVLEKLGEQAVQLARIEERLKVVEKLEGEVSSLKKLEGDVGHLKKLEGDVESLKRRVWTWTGGIAVLSLSAQYLLKLMVK